MKRHRPAGHFICRSATLSLNEGKKFLKTEQSLLSALENPKVRETLETGAPSFYSRLPKMKKEEIVAPLFKLISRMTFRSVPYSTFGGVSVGNISATESSAIQLTDFASHSRVVLSEKHDRTKVNKSALNPTLEFIGDEVRYFVRQSPNQGGYHRVEMRPPKALHDLLRKNEIEQLPEELREALLSHGVLVEKKSTALLKNAEGRVVDIQVHKPTWKAVLSQSDVDRVYRASSAIISLFGRRGYLQTPFVRISRLAEEFVRIFEYRSVPLMDLMDPHSPLASLLDMTDGERLAPSRQFEERLSELLNERGAFESGVLELTYKDVEELKKSFALNDPSLFEDAATFTSFVELLENGKIRLKHVFGRKGVPNCIRYALIDDSIKSAVQRQLILEAQVSPNAIFAAISHIPADLAAASIYPPTDLFSHYIPISTIPDVPSEKIVTLEDLSVRVRNGRFVLWSMSRDQEVVAVMPSAYNTGIDKHPIFKFLSDLGEQSEFRALTWFWGTFAMRFMLPRIELDSVVIQPRLWRVPTHLLDEIRAAKNKPQQNEILNRIVETLQLPSEIGLHSEGEGKRFDLGEALGRELFINEIRRPKRFLIEEILPHSIVECEGEYHAHDLMIPFVRSEVAAEDRTKARKRSPAKSPEQSSKKPVHPPARSRRSEEWTFVSLYPRRSDTLGFLSNELVRFVNTLPAGTQWFYIQYFDPEYHIRLRVQGLHRKRVEVFAQEMIERGYFHRFAMGTYQPEIERYGGDKGCRLFEELSKVDSHAALKVQKLVKEAELPREEILALAASLSSLGWLRLFDLDPAVIKSRFERPKLAERSKQNILIKTITAITNGSYERRETSTAKRLAKIYESRDLSARKVVKSLKDIERKGQLETELAEYMHSVMHMSLNRLNVVVLREFEEFVFSIVKGRWHYERSLKE